MGPNLSLLSVPFSLTLAISFLLRQLLTAEELQILWNPGTSVFKRVSPEEINGTFYFFLMKKASENGISHAKEVGPLAYTNININSK